MKYQYSEFYERSRTWQLKRRASENHAIFVRAEAASGTISQCTDTFTQTNTTDLWTNCCPDQGNLTSSNCPPIHTYDAQCPDNYSSCADSTKHPEMCPKGSHDGYTAQKALGKKCCPQNYTCGSTFDASCKWIDPSGIQHFTNPQYVTNPGVFPGCDEGGISPTAVGAIVAVVILGICFLGGFALWFVRRRLYRDPARRRSKSIARHNARMEQEISISSTGTYNQKEGYLPEECTTSPRKFQFALPKLKSRESSGSNQTPPLGEIKMSMTGDATTNKLPNLPPHGGLQRPSSLHENPKIMEPGPSQQRGSVGITREDEDLGNGITVTRVVEVVCEEHPGEISEDDDGYSNFSRHSQVRGSREPRNESASSIPSCKAVHGGTSSVNSSTGSLSGSASMIPSTVNLRYNVGPARIPAMPPPLATTFAVDPRMTNHGLGSPISNTSYPTVGPAFQVKRKPVSPS